MLTQIAMVIGPVTALSAVGQLVQQSSGALLRINEVLAATPDVTDRPDARPLPPVSRSIRFARRRASRSHRTGRRWPTST